MASIKSHTCKDGTTTWRVRFRNDGRSCSVTFPNRGGAEQFGQMVDQWGAKVALEFIQQPTEPRRIACGLTVRECVADYISLRPNPSTRNTYTGWLENAIAPTLGSIRINQLRKEDIQRWLNSQGSASATILRNHILLSAALKESALRGEIPSNPAAGVKIPRMPRNEARAALTPPYTREEYELIRESISARYRVLVEFLGETGCRFGEAAALTPADVNTSTSQVHFNKSYSYRTGLGYAIGNTKTVESDRVIRVRKSLLEKLNLSDEFVFTTRAGERVKDNAFRAHHWRHALGRSGLPNRRHGHPHDLRHAHATWLLDAGISLPAIQKRLGHANVMTTLGLYGHAAADSEDKIIAALG